MQLYYIPHGFITMLQTTKKIDADRQTDTGTEVESQVSIDTTFKLDTDLKYDYSTQHSHRNESYQGTLEFVIDMYQIRQNIQNLITWRINLSTACT